MVAPVNPLHQLREFGQSPWCDQLSRELLDSGLIKQLVDDYGITGLTSNPTIFQKALASGTSYDLQIARSAHRGHNTQEIYEELAAADIQAVADLLKPIYEATNRIDGFVSFEVSPELAYDADASVAEARRLHAAVGRPNVMIKIPATSQGLQAIKQLLSEGISVNATLVFGLTRYRELLEAHAQGLALAHKAHVDLKGVASVASFFVSRVDTAADREIEAKLAATSSDEERTRLQSLRGTAAIANARAAYDLWRKFLARDTMLSLSALGARPQRLLWASTGTKNPAYSDVLYVEELVGRHTVNTMPLDTIKAFADHGRVRGETLATDAESTKRQLRDLASQGINLESIGQELEAAGVTLFRESFAQLLADLERKAALLVARQTYKNAIRIPTAAGFGRSDGNGVAQSAKLVPIFVGVGGDSGSGKSTLTSAFFNLFGQDRIASICLDDYHALDRRERSMVGVTALNPRANNFALMEEQLWLLKNGSPVDKPSYNHSNGSIEGPEHLEAREVVIIQGLHPFLLPGIRNAFDLKVWLDPEPGLRQVWKIQRDVKKRGYTREQVMEELEAREPDAERYIRPQRKYADMVVRFYRDEPWRDMGHLNVRIIQRHTLPRLNFDKQLLRAQAVHLSLDVADEDGQRSDIIDIDGGIEKAEAALVEDTIWAHIDGRHGNLMYVLPAMLGSYEAARTRRHSNPLALTQLILAHRILSAQKSIILRATTTTVAAAT
ncbi:MAG: transaldolase [Candidatus Eremiobacteraeota bacterium]|nr:transaldolase [Candidatus Eremiobacteraeota bacterium]